MNDKNSKLIKVKFPAYAQENSTIIGLWWTFWVVSSIAGNISLCSFDLNTINCLINSALSDIILSLLGIPLAILAVKVIQGYNAKEVNLAKLENTIELNSLEEE